MESLYGRLRRWLLLQSGRFPGGALWARRLVRKGYNEMAATYAEWSATAENNRKRNLWVEGISRSLPPGTNLLDLGCGPGHELGCWHDAGLVLTGVDLSAANLVRARAHAPGATLHCADMIRQRFPGESFEVVTAFYSLIHIPWRWQIRMVRRTFDWLKPGGLLMANLAARPFEAMVDDHWLGVPMYWSSPGADRARRLLGLTGYSLLREELAVETALGRQNTFFWFVAQKPGEPDDSAAWSHQLLLTLNQVDPPARSAEDGEVRHG